MRKPNVKRIKSKWGGTIVRGVCMAAGVIVVLVALWIGMGRIYSELEGHIRNSMRDVANQNAIALSAEIRAKASLLRGMAAGLPEAREDIESQLYQVHDMKELYGFRRMGYIEPDGDAYTSDGVTTNLAHREYFQRAMQGNITVSESIYDTVGDVGTYINIMAAPVYTADGTSVRGVLFVLYETGQFRDLLTIESFGGLGTSGIALHDGTLLVGSEQHAFLEGQNLLDVIAACGAHNDDAVAALRESFDADRECFVAYTADEEKYIYCAPLILLDGELEWHLITLVPASVLDERMEPIQRIVAVLGAVSILAVLVFLLVLVYSYWKQRKQLEEISYIDSLTGGDSYTAFRAKMREQKQVGYIVSADLSGFKIINNTCGVKRGDELLRAMWGELSGMCRTDELAAHVSGDRFVLFLQGKNAAKVQQRVETCGERIRALSAELKISHVVPKFGIYAIEEPGDPEDGYGKAILAKKQLAGRVDSCCAWYNEELRLDSIADQWMEDNFDRAVAEEQFEVWFQPKYSPLTGLPVGAEALVRWRGDDGTLIPPGQFIPLFERDGLIARLDRYVFQKTCEAQRRWADAGMKTLPVSVNMSRASLFSHDVVETYRSVVEQTGIDIALIQLEITESVMMDNQWVEEHIRCLRQAGFDILLDDFGSGYSSMALLSTNCFRTIKLDKSLIDCIGDASGEKLLTQISGLAHGLGLSITAEGVEEQEQVRFLTDIRCDDIQGFFFSRPIPAADYEAILKRMD